MKGERVKIIHVFRLFFALMKFSISIYPFVPTAAQTASILAAVCKGT